MNWCPRIGVRSLCASVVNLVVIDGEKPFIHVLVSPENEINSVLVKEVLKSRRSERGKSLANLKTSNVHHWKWSFWTYWIASTSTFVSRISIAVHRSVADSNDPRIFGPHLLGVVTLQVLLDPVVLIEHLSYSVFCEKVKLGGKANDVCRSDIEAEKVIVHFPRLVVDHREAIDVVGEVAGQK